MTKIDCSYCSVEALIGDERLHSQSLIYSFLFMDESFLMAHFNAALDALDGLNYGKSYGVY